MKLDGTEDSSVDQSVAFSNGNGQHVAPSTPHKPFANGSSTNGDSNGHTALATRPSGPFFGHDREEVTRIIIQGLSDLGYQGAASTLSRESGYELENTAVAAFRNAIQQGDWVEAEALLFGSRPDMDASYPGGSLERTWDEGQSSPGLPLAAGADKKAMLFLIRRQKYLELLERREVKAALLVLREQITPSHQMEARLHDLASLMMSPTVQDLHRMAQWDGSAGESRKQLLSELSTSIAPSVMIPEHRLAVLFDKVQQYEIDQCTYHTSTTEPSLYHDHFCDRANFPLSRIVELDDHTGEVWHIAFSPGGKYLATAAGNNIIAIYDTDDWKLAKRLVESPSSPDPTGIASLSWSPDDKYLISCSVGHQATIYNIEDGGRKHQTIEGYGWPVSAASWLPNGKAFVIASQDPDRALELYKLGDSRAQHSFINRGAGCRVRDCKISGDGSRLAAITVDKRVQVYDLNTRDLMVAYGMDEAVTCIDLSLDGSQLLVSMCNSQVRLIETLTGNLVQRFQGVKQEENVIRVQFGGAGQQYVLTGSEDSHVYLYRRRSGATVAAFPAHGTSVVNTVAWHPQRMGIFASGGDDHKVIIWGSQSEIDGFQHKLLLESSS